MITSSQPVDSETPGLTAIAALKLRIEEDIAVLRRIAIEPVDIAYSEIISFEVRPTAEGDRFSVYRKNWGGTTINYSARDLDVEIFGESDVRPVESAHVERDRLVDDPENELKAETLNAIGYEVKADCDQPGLWVWINVASLEGCDQSFESESQAVQAAWDEAGHRACAALECSWNGGTVLRQSEILLSAFNTDTPPASALSDTPN